MNDSLIQHYKYIAGIGVSLIFMLEACTKCSRRLSRRLAADWGTDWAQSERRLSRRLLQTAADCPAAGRAQAKRHRNTIRPVLLQLLRSLDFDSLLFTNARV